MAYPASQTVVRNALDSVTSNALRMKGLVQSLRNQSAAGATARRSYIALQRQIQLGLDAWDVSAAVPGLAQYARDQYADQELDIVAEYQAMRTAAVAVRDWIFAAIPTDASSGIANATAESQGSSVATGISGAIVPAVATSPGGSSAAGLSLAVATAVGNASGDVTVLGATRAVWTAVGGSAGVSVALGESDTGGEPGVIATTGSGAGVSVALGISGAICRVSGVSAGVGVANGYSTPAAIAVPGSRKNTARGQYQFTRSSRGAYPRRGRS